MTVIQLFIQCSIPAHTVSVFSIYIYNS